MSLGGQLDNPVDGTKYLLVDGSRDGSGSQAFVTSVITPLVHSDDGGATALLIRAADTTIGSGGDLTLRGGDFSGISGDGGDVIIRAGVNSGLSTAGKITFFEPDGTTDVLNIQNGVGVVINEGGDTSVDFRAESVANSSMLRLDSSANTVDIADVKILNTALDSDNINFLINTPGVITQGAGFAGSPGYRFMEIQENGSTRMWIDDSLGNAIRFYSPGRMDFQSATTMFFSAPSGFFMQANTSFARTGDATSTANQKDSRLLGWQNSLWTGSGTSKLFHQMRNKASRITNLASQLVFYMNTSDNNAEGTESARILHTGEWKIGSTDETARARLEVDQANASAAVPTLLLDQADISEEMIEFVTTIGTGNAIEAVGAKALTTTHFIKATIPGGLTVYIPCGTIA